MALAQIQERLKVIIENAPVGLWAVYKGGRFTMAEGCGLESWAFQGDEVIGQQVGTFALGRAGIDVGIARALAGDTFSNETH